MISATLRKWRHLVKEGNTICNGIAKFNKNRTEIFNPANRPPIIDLSEFDVSKIRNFSIVAHIDHGKSTLSERLLELTNTIKTDLKSHDGLFLDRLQVEKERGITVKAQSASMFYEHSDGVMYLLNLIDTPGHVDFSYEVTRSLSACDGVLLLVDANDGVQAQTVANFWMAFERELVIIPVINKIDLPRARPEIVLNQIMTVFDIPTSDCLKISAKTGEGVSQLFSAIIDRIPPPKGEVDDPFVGFIFDSWYEQFRGVFAAVLVKDGFIEKGQSICSAASGNTYEVTEVGIIHPNIIPVNRLFAGQVGYVLTQVKSIREIKVGATLFWKDHPRVPIPGFRDPKPMVFAGLFPVESSDFDDLKKAIDKLTLNDPSVTFHFDHSPALGPGFKMGFLGILHMEVFNQRLEQEHDASVILTAPSVPYKAVIKDNEGIRKRHGGKGEITIVDTTQYPLFPFDVEYFLEPMATATIIMPREYYGTISNLCMSRRGNEVSATLIDSDRMMCRYNMPLAEIIIDFFDQLKRSTSGYASFDYEESGYREIHLIKLDILLNGDPVNEFSVVVPEVDARTRGLQIAAALKREIPQQQFDVAIQAVIGKKVVARETVRAMKKDVTAKLKSGGDVTRRKKQFARQKEGKARLKLLNSVPIPKEAFLNVFKR